MKYQDFSSDENLVSSEDTIFIFFFIIAWFFRSISYTF